MACQEVPRRQDWIVRLPARDFFLFSFFLSPPPPPRPPSSSQVFLFEKNKKQTPRYIHFILLPPFCSFLVRFFASRVIFLISLLAAVFSVISSFQLHFCLVSFVFTLMRIPPPPPQPSLLGRTTKAGIADGQRSPPLFQKLITQTSHFIQPLSFILFLSFLLITCSSYISLWCIIQILTVLFLCCTRNIRLPLLHGFTFLSLLGAALFLFSSFFFFFYFTLRNLAKLTIYSSALTVHCHLRQAR